MQAQKPNYAPFQGGTTEVFFLNCLWLSVFSEKMADTVYLSQCVRTANHGNMNSKQTTIKHYVHYQLFS